jgi:hypothetical protein
MVNCRGRKVLGKGARLVGPSRRNQDVDSGLKRAIVWRVIIKGNVKREYNWERGRKESLKRERAFLSCDWNELWV